MTPVAAAAGVFFVRMADPGFELLSLLCFVAETDVFIYNTDGAGIIRIEGGSDTGVGICPEWGRHRSVPRLVEAPSGCFADSSPTRGALGRVLRDGSEIDVRDLWRVE